MSSRRAQAVFALLLGALLLGCPGEEPAVARPSESAPDFELPLLGGGEVTLAAQRGRIVILDFWATWCAPCEVQMPILDALWRERGGDRLMIVGLSVDSDPPAEVAAWVAERGFRYPLAIADQELALRYGILGFPSLVIVDPEGRIRLRHTGVLRRDEIEAELEAIEAVSSRVSDSTKG
jgi:cytochrome c biogenesis protein CcmG, thiol:disulfide interchange protein DsbE